MNSTHHYTSKLFARVGRFSVKFCSFYQFNGLHFCNTLWTQLLKALIMNCHMLHQEFMLPGHIINAGVHASLVQWGLFWAEFITRGFLGSKVETATNKVQKYLKYQPFGDERCPVQPGCRCILIQWHRYHSQWTLGTFWSIICKLLLISLLQIIEACTKSVWPYSVKYWNGYFRMIICSSPWHWYVKSKITI